MEKTTETKVTEKPVEILQPGVERTTETKTAETKTETVPQVPEKQPDGTTVAKDAPTEDGARFL